MVFFWSKAAHETKLELKDHVQSVHEINHVFTLSFISSFGNGRGVWQGKIG